MNWRVLHNLIHGLLGNSLLIISLATPVAILMGYGIILPLYRLALIGALLIVAAHILVVIGAPSLITAFADGYGYAGNLQVAKKHECIDFVSEFKVLEENSTKLPKGYNSMDFKNYDFKTLDASVSELGENISVRSLALIKYDYINITKPLQRWIITLILCAGLLMLYTPITMRIITVINGGGK